MTLAPKQGARQELLFYNRYPFDNFYIRRAEVAPTHRENAMLGLPGWSAARPTATPSVEASLNPARLPLLPQHKYNLDVSVSLINGNHLPSHLVKRAARRLTSRFELVEPLFTRWRTYITTLAVHGLLSCIIYQDGSRRDNI